MDIMQIAGALAALGILVMVHEGGHFLAARWLGVLVEKFSIGFGPRLFGFKGRTTEYRLSLIPLGGYVKMKGENPDEEVSDPEGSFSALSWWKRVIIAFSGPLANLILALLILITTFYMGKDYEDYGRLVGAIKSPTTEIDNLTFLQPGDELLEINGQELRSWTDSYLYLQDGENEILIKREDKELIFQEEISYSEWMQRVLPQTTTIIGDVSPGLPAYNAGLMEGDEIVSVDGQTVTDWYEMRDLIVNNQNTSVELRIKREDGEFTRNIKLQENVLDGNRVIGITQKLPLKVHESYNIWESVKYGTISTVDYVLINYIGLYKLLLKPAELKNNIGGPVLMYTMSKQTAKRGWNSILTFMALISIVLMVMNLLPIPILDGGMIFFCIIEGIRKKALSLKIQMTLQKIGFSLLLLLMFFAFSNDFMRIFQRNVSISNQKAEMLEQGN
ncbi:MAG: RIP metalloprotease RseP [Candidatus Cloacimonetes bacterium]|nr:RIP metalloprotease RseP [Candidatus Cloacimonadota bacterium]